MYIFMPQEQSGNESFYNGFMDAINILSFMIGLENLELNVTAKDLAEQKDYIVNDLHDVIGKIDKHLVEQDNHLSAQDRHLLEQDMRLDRLEKLMYDEDYMARKESQK